MPTAKELTIRVEDRPGTLGRACRALAEYSVNIVALQSVLSRGEGLVRFVVDDLARARRALDNEGLSYQETEVAQAKLSNRPGEVARAATRLGEADINITYAYCGLDPKSNTPLLILGVADAEEAAAILDRAVAAA
jgi:hypothetical protein